MDFSAKQAIVKNFGGPAKNRDSDAPIGTTSSTKESGDRKGWQFGNNASLTSDAYNGGNYRFKQGNDATKTMQSGDQGSNALDNLVSFLEGNTLNFGDILSSLFKLFNLDDGATHNKQSNRKPGQTKKKKRPGTPKKQSNKKPGQTKKKKGPESPKKQSDDNPSKTSDRKAPPGGSKTKKAAPSNKTNEGSGEKVLVNETIVVEAGEVFDGQGKTYVAGSELGDGSQSESQKPVFRLKDGATLKNVNLTGENGGAADGVHTYGDASIENVHWLDVGEDALTKKEPGDITIRDSSMANGEDKGIQDNAAGSITVINSHFENLGKAYRQNGGKDFPAKVEFINSTFSNIDEAIMRSDSPNFEGRLVDSKVEGDTEAFMVPSSASTSTE